VIRRRPIAALLALLVVLAAAGCGVEARDAAVDPPVPGPATTEEGSDGPTTSTSEDVPIETTTSTSTPSTTTTTEPPAIEDLAEAFRAAVAPANCVNGQINTIFDLNGGDLDEVVFPEVKQRYVQWADALRSAADELLAIDWGDDEIADVAEAQAESMQEQATAGDALAGAATIDEFWTVEIPTTGDPDALRRLLDLPSAAEDRTTDWCALAGG